MAKPFVVDPIIVGLKDPTLEAVNKAVAAEGNAEPPRAKLGASGVGHPCERKSWLQFRWALDRDIEPKGVRAIRSGHRGEDEMAEDLRKVPGIQLWTEGDDGRQIGFMDLNDHFGGSLDGIIKGLIQAPVTPHVWENKVCNEKKVARLQELKDTVGEKQALKAWDAVYWAQAQLYMHYLQLDRHYLTCCTPGLRDVVSVRTEYDMAEAMKLQIKAARIIFSARPPAKLSEDPSWYECKYCDFWALCHEVEKPVFPSVNCRTCTHSTPLQESEMPADAEGTWHCAKFDNTLSTDRQREGCSAHLFHPDMVPGVAEESDGETVSYVLRNGETWIDGPK